MAIEFTRKQIKGFVQEGIAIDITHFGSEQIDKLLADGKTVRRIGYSVGKYGVNALLLQDSFAQLYAITDSYPPMFRF